MLEHVALSQTHFNMPGVAADGRGILLGKLGALSFPSVDRLVAFFRLFCRESSLEDLSPKLRIEEVRSPLHTREFCVFFPASSSYLLDRVARVGRTAGGHVFTGSSKHFVCYRDEHSPLGYDLTALYTESADYVLYTDTFTQAYTRQKELPFSDLVFRLSPRAMPRRDEDERELLYLTAPSGLGPSLIRYLWRTGVRAEAALLEPNEAGTFTRTTRFYLFRVHDLPVRMLRLFLAVPGLVTYRPVGDHCAVQVGFRHPFRLEACGALFEKGRLHLFSGREGVRVVNEPPLVPLADLIDGGFQLEELGPPAQHEAERVQLLHLGLRLRPTSVRRRVIGTRVPWSNADQLKKLVYLLPPTMLDGLRLFALKEGLFVIGEQGIEGLPLGELFQELTPGILVPLGLGLEPRVRGEVLAEQLGGVAGRYIIFLREGRVLAIEQAHFQPLGRQHLARLEVERPAADSRLKQTESVPAASVLNEETGLFPLWGFRSE